MNRSEGYVCDAKSLTRTKYSFDFDLPARTCLQHRAVHDAMRVTCKGLLMNHIDSDAYALRKIVEICATNCDWGVFARSKIRKRSIVGRIRGTIVAGVDYCSNYCMELDDQTSLEPHAPFRYLNHSCSPNCQIVGFSADEIESALFGEFEHADYDFIEQHSRSNEDLRGMLFIQTLKKVRPGDQLTIDYAWPAELAVRCLCGKKKCRGWIVAKDELHLISDESVANGAVGS